MKSSSPTQKKDSKPKTRKKISVWAVVSSDGFVVAAAPGLLATYWDKKIAQNMAHKNNAHLVRVNLVSAPLKKKV